MKKKHSLFVIAAFLFSFTVPAVLSAQEEEEDEKKMLREVIDVQIDRPAAPVVPGTPAEDAAHSGKKKKKKHEDPPPDVVPMDSSSTIPAPVGELKKRGTAWMNKKEKAFAKTDAAANGNSVECTVSFSYKPKELNPGAPVEGKITMKVIIDCKEGKYRYTIKDIRHVASRNEFSGGDVFNDVPACGSLYMPDPQWKKIKSFATQKANEVAYNLKESMKNPVSEKKDEW